MLRSPWGQDWGCPALRVLSPAGKAHGHRPQRTAPQPARPERPPCLQGPDGSPCVGQPVTQTSSQWAARTPAPGVNLEKKAVKELARSTSEPPGEWALQPELTGHPKTIVPPTHAQQARSPSPGHSEHTAPQRVAPSLRLSLGHPPWSLQTGGPPQ